MGEERESEGAVAEEERVRREKSGRWRGRWEAEFKAGEVVGSESEGVHLFLGWGRMVSARQEKRRGEFAEDKKSYPFLGWNFPLKSQSHSLTCFLLLFIRQLMMILY